MESVINDEIGYQRCDCSQNMADLICVTRIAKMRSDSGLAIDLRISGDIYAVHISVWKKIAPCTKEIARSIVICSPSDH